MEKYLYKDLHELENRHWWHLVKRQRVINILTKYLKKHKNRILDIGCGTGRNLQSFEQFGSVLGIDNAKEAIEYCRAKRLNVHLASSDDTGFSSNYFDAVILLDVLEHVEENRTLKEIKRILKPDKYLIITVPAFSWLWSHWDVILHHRRRYSKESLKKILKDNNFQILEISYMYSFLVLPVILIRTMKAFFLKTNYGSDFELSSPLINKILYNLANLEIIISNKISIPFGTSIVCLASKNE